MFREVRSGRGLSRTHHSLVSLVALSLYIRSSTLLEDDSIVLLSQPVQLLERRLDACVLLGTFEWTVD